VKLFVSGVDFPTELPLAAASAAQQDNHKEENHKEENHKEEN
jgi:ribosomal protein L12E/L44/L45/RPP1/RPP2